jgi:hypothetical protein
MAEGEEEGFHEDRKGCASGARAGRWTQAGAKAQARPAAATPLAERLDERGAELVKELMAAYNRANELHAAVRCANDRESNVALLKNISRNSAWGDAKELGTIGLFRDNVIS